MIDKFKVSFKENLRTQLHDIAEAQADGLVSAFDKVMAQYPDMTEEQVEEAVYKAACTLTDMMRESTNKQNELIHNIIQNKDTMDKIRKEIMEGSNGK